MTTKKLVKRGKGGRFAKGTAPGPGSPHAGKVMRAKRVVFETVDLKDIEDVVREITKRAKAGEPWACRLFVELILGKPDHRFDPGLGGAQESGDPEGKPEATPLREQLLFYRGAAAALEAQLRAQDSTGGKGD